jgi:hypothetical protein
LYALPTRPHANKALASTTVSPANPAFRAVESKISVASGIIEVSLPTSTGHPSRRAEELVAIRCSLRRSKLAGFSHPCYLRGRPIGIIDPRDRLHAAG